MLNIPINILPNVASQSGSLEGNSLPGESHDFNSLISSLNKGLFSNDTHCNLDVCEENISEVLSSLEEFIMELINSKEDIELNEDISFLQAIIPFILNNSENFNSMEESDYGKILSSFSENFDINKEFLNKEINLNELSSQDLMHLEFLKDIDKDFLNKLKSLDSLLDKKEMLIQKFEEFSKSYTLEDESSNIDVNGFYNAFKTNKEVSFKSSVELKDVSVDNIDSIEGIDTSDMIEFLNQNDNSSKSIDSINSSKPINFKTFVLNQETLVDDLHSTILNMKNSHLKQLKLKLSPKELGEMTIDISQLDNVSKIVLTVSNQDTLNIIKSNLKLILEHLKDAKLVSSDSSIVVQSEQSNKDTFSTFSGFNSKNNNNKKDTFDNLSNDNISSIDEQASLNTHSNILNILA